MNNYSIGIVGAGQMGSGIAGACALYSFRVKLIDTSLEVLDRAGCTISTQLQYFKDKVSNSIDAISELISYHTDLNALQDVNIVIEAIPEIIDLKQNLYKNLNTIVKPDTLIATNTSSFPITELASSIVSPERFIGIHFMNPVLRMNLVELIPSKYTNNITIQKAKEFIDILQKTTIISADQPGFVVNRLLIPLINQAFIALDSKLASKEDIDIAMEKGAGFPMGPLKLADFIGLDTCLSIMENLNQTWPKQGYTPSSLLKAYVKTNRLGRKTKEGVYLY
jgi:3-hydroxybutyryl-CoA dehydrogenase